MPRAFSMGSTPVINLGGQQHDYALAALEEMQAHQQQRQQEEEANAKFRAQEFGKRLGSYADQPEMAAQAARDFAAKDPAAAKFLTPYTEQLPQTPGMQTRSTVANWQAGFMPKFLEALQTHPESVDPQMFMTMYPFLSQGDKAMDPGIVSFLVDRYVTANEGRLPADLVKQFRLKSHIDMSPEEIAKDQTERYKADQGLAGTKYSADETFKGKKYETDAQAPLRGAEAGAWNERGRMWGSRADVNENEDAVGQIENHPAIQATKAHISDLQQQRNQALIEARTAGKDAKVRAEAQSRATAAEGEIAAYQQSLKDMRMKMAKSMGVEYEEGVDDGAGPFRENEPRNTVLPGPAGRSSQPKINDNRGSNVPSGSSPAAAAPRPSAAAPSAQVRGNSVPAAAPAPQQGTAQAVAGIIRESGGDPAKKVITRSGLQRLQQQLGQKIDTTGWTVLDQ